MFERLIVFSLFISFTYNKPTATKFPGYHYVTPLTVRPGEMVPSYILHPDYAFHPEGREETPNYLINKTEDDIQTMKQSCSLARSILNTLRNYIKAGISTEEIDIYAHELLMRQAAYPSLLHYKGFPRSISTCVNNIVANGIPDNRKLKNGDIITVHIKVFKNNFHGSSAETFLVGDVDDDAIELVDAARDVLSMAIQSCRPYELFYTIGQLIGREAQKRGFLSLPSIEGKGIGQYLEELPHFPQYENNETLWHREEMLPGMVFTIGPALSKTTSNYTPILDDEWTKTTEDKARVAQFQHTVAITEKGCVVLDI